MIILLIKFSYKRRNLRSILFSK